MKALEMKDELVNMQERLERSERFEQALICEMNMNRKPVPPSPDYFG